MNELKINGKLVGAKGLLNELPSNQNVVAILRVFFANPPARCLAVSEGMAPLQKVAVGIAYTVNALREWREKGPLAGN